MLPNPSIRDKLRDFVPLGFELPSRPIPRDAARIGSTENSMTRVESRSSAEIQAGESSLEIEDDTGNVLPGGISGGDSDNDNVPSLLARPYGVVAPRAGDLIEISTESWRVKLLAVCLGNFRGVDHFYTNTGKWFVSSGVRSLFAVTRFATPEDLAPLIAALPAEALEETDVDLTGQGSSHDAEAFDSKLNMLQDLKLGPSREAGAGLLKKMAEFTEQSSGIHMANAGVLDNAFEVLHMQDEASDPKTQQPKTYMTVEELSSLLLRRHKNKHLGPRGHQTHRHHFPLKNLRGSGSGAEGMDEFTAPAMYAVYRAIIFDDLAFRPLTTTLGNANEADDAASEASTAAGEKIHSHSRSCLFSIAPREDIEIIHEVDRVVRNFLDDPRRIASGGRLNFRDLKRSQLGNFILKARKAIDHSRKTRGWSPYGMLSTGPRDQKQDQNQDQDQDQNQGRNQSRNQDTTLESAPEPAFEQWSSADVTIFQFMHLWASSQRFSPASRLHGTGSAILRALDRYSESEFLVMSTGWTFLQEVGWVTPWDISARYKLGLPDIPPLRTGGLQRSLGLLPPPPLETASTETTTSSSPSSTNSSSAAALSNLSEDIFAGKRKDWGNVTAFCIDAPEAADIDDGVALERIADSPDEFWVHTHVADPASRIRPGSPLAEQASRMPQTAYLPGHHERMFPDDVVRQQLSLGPGQPCLTFSARVNRKGDVLESKITPGRLGRVVFITPSEVSSIVADTEQQAMRDSNIAALAEPSALDLPWKTSSFSVGTPLGEKEIDTSSPASRHMTTADELSPDQKADLETLSSLATALRAVRLVNGAMPLYWPRPSVGVSLDNTSVVIADASARPIGTNDASTVSPSDNKSDNQGDSITATSMMFTSGNPYIRIWYEGADAASAAAAASTAAGSRLVESIMRLAGEVAANWCHERGIAVPFRGQPDAARHLPRLRELTRDEIYPALISGKRPSDASLRELRRLLGADDMTAVSVPHVTMGVPRYTKATSPLRRYSDLLVHWQVEGALLADMEDAKKDNTATAEISSTVGAPFTRLQMEQEILPMLRVRERILRTLDNQAGRDQWILQAMVRAWLGEEARVTSRADKTSEATETTTTKPFSNLHMTISHINKRRGVITGRLDWFERTAFMDVNRLNATGPDGDNDGMQQLTFEDVQPGEVYPVELAHVDVHGNMVLVRRVGDVL
ncbi:3'-5' RNA exonuclease complex component [Sporothrix stenoceras]|uniref:3'-5' RNA exonuclease complex component n=1 Tax=Sporothrix stenoceras TaxID=5173 RepID=A0ABR3ZSD6_9PEZI